MDLDKMQEACNKFIGIHDFRNFCKEDHEKKRSMQRRILSCLVKRNGEIGEMCIKGYSFLWHQIRCMAAIVFRVGVGVEEPGIVDKMLEDLSYKPQYEIASEIGLVLYDCAFETVQFDDQIDCEENATCLARVYESLVVRLEVVNSIYSLFKSVPVAARKPKKIIFK